MSITLSPRSISAHESNPLSVSSYNVQIREADGETVIVGKNQEADPSGDTEIPLGDVIDIGMVGNTITIFVQQVGPTGAKTPFVAAGDVEEHGQFVVREIPDGAETLVVNV